MSLSVTVPAADVVQAHLAFGAVEAHGDLVAAHLQGEEGRGHAVLDGDVAGDVQCQGGLTHGRAGADDDELTGLKAVGQRVKVSEAGRDTGCVRDALLTRVKIIPKALDVFLDEGVAGGVLLARQGVLDFGFHRVLYVVELPFAGVAQLRDPRSGLNQAAQDRVLVDDLGVVGGVGRGRHGLDQGVEVGRAADPDDLAALGELRSDSDGVDGLVLGVQVPDGVLDRFVVRAVVVPPLHGGVDDLFDRVRAQHLSAEHGRFRLLAVRRDALESVVVGPAGAEASSAGRAGETMDMWISFRGSQLRRPVLSGSGRRSHVRTWIRERQLAD